MVVPIQTELIATFAFCVITCSLIGVFLIREQNSCMALQAGITASLGAALGAIFTFHLSSPLLIIPAVLSSFIGMKLAEIVQREMKIFISNAILIVNSLFLTISFFIFNILSYSGGIGINSVIFGELSFIPLQRLEIGTQDIGSIGFYSFIAIFAIVSIVLYFFYKDLKISSIDFEYSICLYSSKKWLHYLLPFMTGLIASVSIQVVGFFMASAFFLLPSSIAMFYTKRLSIMLIISLLTALTATLTGFGIAYNINASPAGTTILVMAALFILSLFFAPEKGVINIYSLKKNQKETVRENILLLDLLDSHKANEISDYYNIKIISKRLAFKYGYVLFLKDKLKRDGYISEENEYLSITEKGKIKAKHLIEEKQWK